MQNVPHPSSLSRYLKYISVLLLFTSCNQRLDSQLYNNSKVDSYKHDDYSGYKELTLDDSYKISDAFVYDFSLFSRAAGETKDTKIYAIYIGDLNKIATDTVIMYCHGNRDHMDMYWNRAKLLANAGGKNRFGVLMIDYRGYGMSEGTPTEEGMYADVDAALQWLQSKGLDDKRLIIYGYSLGTASACELTAHPRTLTPNKIMLEAPFASAEVMVNDAAKLNMPQSYFSDLKIDNAEEIKKIKQPFFWIHGVNDDFLSIKTHGEIVYKNYAGVYSEPHRIDGGVHNNVPQVMGLQEYCKTVTQFICKK